MGAATGHLLCPLPSQGEGKGGGEEDSLLMNSSKQVAFKVNFNIGVKLKNKYIKIF